MAKKGLILSILGITLGICTGFGILILQNYAARELIVLLNEEAEKSTGCDFKVDSINVSLITFSATALNARIECASKPVLLFKKIKAGFSLSDISDRVIQLEKLQLINGHAEGLNEDSATYKFLDSLTTPIAPEKDRPDRWKVKLMDLSMRNTTFNENIGNQVLKGQGLNLDVTRTAEDGFKLLPIVDRLYLSGKNDLLLGKLTADVRIEDQKTLFKFINLRSEKSYLRIQATADKLKNNSLSGDYLFELDTSESFANQVLSGLISGEGLVSGYLSKPKFTGNAGLSKNSKLILSIENINPIEIDKLNALYTVDKDKSEPLVDINKLQFDGADIYSALTENIKIQDDKLNGSAKIKIKNLKRADLNIKNLESAINFKGFIYKPVSQIELYAKDIYFNDLKLPDFSLDGEIQNFDDTETLKAALNTKFILPVVANNAEIKGLLNIDSKQLGLELSDSAQQIFGNFKFNFIENEESFIKLKIMDLAKSSLSYVDECMSLSADLDYNFKNDFSYLGNGALLVDKIIVGCKPYTMQNVSGFKLPIDSGKLQLSGISVEGENSKISIDGDISAERINLESSVSVQLKSFLNLVPKIDELNGILNGNLKIIGETHSPDISGKIKIEKASIDVGSSDISAQNINGELSLENNLLQIQDLEGELNGGSMNLEGVINPFEIQQSELFLNFKNIYTAPLEGLNLELSGSLEVKKLSNSTPTIAGNVQIEKGEFQKNIELGSVIRSIPSYLIGNSKTESINPDLPNIDLDLQIKATRNLFIFTNWLNAELQSDLEIKGNLSQPLISGQIDVLNGWLGFKDRNFEINSGKLTFIPGQSEPRLELISETFVNSRTGNNVQVILEASGSISSPKISLASDRALNQQELLALITSGGTNVISQTRANSLSNSLNFDQSNPDFLDILLDPFTLVDYITQIDSLSIEPAYNYLSGAIDPVIVAKKKLLERLSLEGRSFLGSSENLSRAQLIYNLTPKINVAGLMESVSSRSQTAAEVNSTYTILSSQSRNLDIQVEGEDQLSELAILNTLRINYNSRIPCQHIEQIKDELLKYYESNGFFDAAINLESECKSETLSKLKIQISENKISEIKRINYSGDPLPKIISTKEIAEQLMDQIASEKLVKETEASIIKKLRNEGYISSRVNFKYSTTEDGINKVANINIYLGRPVSFTFIGNTVFGAAEFLDTINLFSRKLPLGSNTINLLVDAIEKKYRDSGYLYASINQEKIINPDGRIDYIIRIKEESQIDVKSVIFEGNLKIGNQKLELLLKETDPLLYEQVMHPKYVQAESIESNINALKDIYHSEGYPETTVDYRIDQLSENNSVNIVYQIKEGKEQKADWLDISGLPEDIELNKDIQGSYSIESANQKLDQFLNELQNLGYYEASFSSEFDFNNKKLKVEFIPGPPTLIQSIEIQGNEKIKDAVIYKHLLFKAGDYWNNNKILESRKKLLKLGLFSKVEISAKNAQIDSRNEPLIIRVIERPLQSLEIGAGANSALGTHIFAQATDRSLFKDGKSISLINDIYYDPRESGISQGIAGLVYTHPELFNSDYTLTEDLRYQKLDTSAQEFDLDRASLASYVYKNYNENLTLSLGHSILDENLTNVAQDAIISNLDEGNVRLSFISGFITLDKRDVPLNAKNGYVLNFDYKLSSQALASQADFYSLGTRASYVTPLENIYDKLSFAANSRLASSWTFADTNEVPISQRFYTGGRSSIRGYRENSLGPRGKDGSIIGGDTLVVNNFELRYLAASNTSLISFFDAGTVFLKDQSNSIGDIRTSVGIGVRLISPIGPIGFDIGHALDEKPGEPSVRFHFNIGSNF